MHPFLFLRPFESECYIFSKIYLLKRAVHLEVLLFVSPQNSNKKSFKLTKANRKARGNRKKRKKNRF